MSRVIIGMVMLVLMAMVGQATAQEPATEPVQIVGSVCALSDQQFSQQMDFGLKLGTIVPLDGGKNMYLRTLYSRWNFRPNSPIQSIKINLLVEYWLGKGWWVYGLGGGDFFVGGDNKGGDWSGGFGGAKTILTVHNDQKVQDGRLDVFADIDFTDASGQVTGSYFQLNFGVKFAPPAGEITR